MTSLVSGNCAVCGFGSSDNRNLWKCEGCSLRFHAACAGVQRNKEDQIRSYMMPACNDCQERIAMELNFRHLVHQQALLADLVKKHSDAIHKSTSTLQKIGIVQEALERQETLFDELKQELSSVKKVNSPTKVVRQINNHVTTLFDDAITSAKVNMTESLGILSNSITNKLTSHIDEITNKVDEQLEAVNENLIDVATSKTQCSVPEILEEFRIISSRISEYTPRMMPIENSIGYPSVADEITMAGQPSNDLPNSGWRFLGSRKVWKQDWTAYDTKLHRIMQQQKQADKARKRRARRRNHYRRNNYNRNNNPRHNHIIHNNNNDNNNNFVNNNRNNYNSNYYNNNNNSNNNRNNKNYFNNNNNNQNQNRNLNFNRNLDNNHQSTNRNNYNFNTNSNRRYTNHNRHVNNSFLNNNNSPNYNMANRQQNNVTNSYNNQQHTNSNRFHANQLLPPDRVLLAAAKDRFSRPQSNFIPTIQFQRGETLNPYPANDEFSLSQPQMISDPAHLPTSQCIACSSRHSCLQRN